MSKLIQALLSGMLITFILDFFLFLGIKLHYIDFYQIDVYYNILFADHQNIYIYMLLSVILGYITMYLQSIKISLSIITLLFVLSLLTLVQPIGYNVGAFMLMKKNTTLYDDRYKYQGDIYYNGRKQITFYDYDLKKVIYLDKNKLKNKEF